MQVKFIASPTFTNDTLVAGVFQGKTMTAGAAILDEKMQGRLAKAMKSNHFKGKAGEVLEITEPAGVEARRILLVGLGESDKLKEFTIQTAGASVVDRVMRTPDDGFEFITEGIESNDISNDRAAALLAMGALLKSWRFDKYKTKTPTEQLPHVGQINFVTANPSQAEELFEAESRVVDGVFKTRELVSEPPNILYPETMAEQALELKKLGLEVEVFGEKSLKKLGMNAMLGVAQGSIREPQMIVVEWRGAEDPNAAPIVVVGKGVTFDTGGISLKPSNAMEEMKYDMAGSGVVFGLMKALAGRYAKVNVVGVMGMVENMPSGNAQRPSDVVTSMSGQTIEILNTDAEGRLVLADVLWYAQDRFKPKAMIDLATLTGAIRIALGEEYAGLFSNNDDLADKIFQTGLATNEKVWRLPLHENFDKDVDSDIADVRNTQKTAGAAGSITAAQFLQRFVNNVPWAHLDIAAVSWAHKPLPLCQTGATGFGVRLLDRLIRDHYEAKA